MGRHRLSERIACYRKRKRAGFQVVLSEGDSWFSYEFYRNVIDHLDDDEMFAHHRLEMSGDTVQNMIGDPRALDGLRAVVRDEKPLFVLFSGGGNDMQNKAKDLFQPGATAEDCLVPDVMDSLFGTLKACYQRLIKAIGPDAPVVAHGYDYFQPQNRGVRVAASNLPVGPWFYPEMVARKISTPDLQLEVAKLIVNRFNDDLASLATSHSKDFVHVDLRGTLDPQCWMNEIHPTEAGFGEVKDKLLEAISEKVHPLVLDRQGRRAG